MDQNTQETHIWVAAVVTRYVNVTFDGMLTYTKNYHEVDGRVVHSC